jgi:hypothetical protein
MKCHAPSRILRFASDHLQSMRTGTLICINRLGALKIDLITLQVREWLRKVTLLSVGSRTAPSRCAAVALQSTPPFF